jgi:cytochrome c biogenesis protein CcdA
MTNLPYIAAAYAIGIVVPSYFAVAAWLRVGAARRKLAAIDPRAHRADRKGSAA